MKEWSVASLLHEVNHLMLVHKSEALREFGITFPQMLVLGYLSDNDSEVNQRMICDNMHLKGSSVTSLLCNMEKNGLIIRKDNPSDGRGNIINLTERGKEISEKIKDIFVKIDEKALSVLTKEETEVMRSLLGKIKDAEEKRTSGNDLG